MTDLVTLLGFGPNAWGPALLGGALVTVKIAFASYALGLVIGLAGAWAKLKGPRVVRSIAEGYTTVMRGVPDILVILFVFYGGTSALRSLMGALAPDARFEISPFLAAAVSLGLICGAYATEVFRGAILAVPASQMEAANALSLPRHVAFRYVVLPQMLRFALPPLGNLWLVILKNSALISVVGVRDLVGVAATGASTTRLPFVFYTTVAFIFLAMSVVSMAAFHVAERLYGRGYERT